MSVETGPTLRRVQGRKGYHALADHLREQILSGSMPDGTALPNERVLGGRNGLSRGSVREALRMLEVEGLVSTKPGRNGGSLTQRPGPANVSRSVAAFVRGQRIPFDAVLEAREMLEPTLAALAAANRTGTDLDAIAAALADMIAAGDDNAGFVAANSGWHWAIAEASHNALLVAMIAAVGDILHQSNIERFVSADVRSAVIRAPCRHRGRDPHRGCRGRAPPHDPPRAELPSTGDAGGPRQHRRGQQRDPDMNFGLSEDQEALCEAVRRIVQGFGDAYWLDCDRTGTFPTAFTKAIAAGGWLGIAMPVEYGGAGLGVTDAALMMNVVARSPGAQAAASSIHMNIFGPHPIVVHGTAEQKQRWLPPLIHGSERACFGVTEPDAGLDTTRAKTRAERVQGGYQVHGQKIWTSTAQVADKIMLLARTTPIEQCKRPVDGLTLFYADLNRASAEVRLIHKMGRHAVDSNQVFFDGMPIPECDRIGEEGRGFHYLLDSLNPERVLVGIEAVGIGQHALDRAANYARERVVFGRPIGQNQSIQHPLALNWMELESAFFDCLRAAWMYDSGLACGPQANAAKYAGADAGYRACLQAGDDAWRHGLRAGIPCRTAAARKHHRQARPGQRAIDPLQHRGTGC